MITHTSWVKFQLPNLAYQACAIPAFADDQGFVVVVEDILHVVGYLDDRTNFGLHIGIIIAHIHK